MKLNSLTPCCTVEAIEPSLPFWIDRLGFTKVSEVPHNGSLAFVILVRDETSVMLQTRASVAQDLPFMADTPLGGGVMLFINVEDLDPVLRAVEGADIVVPERTTFYGMREVWVRSPGGMIIGFAQRVEEDD
ncbi:MAG: hypothetical protein HN348_31895 [Proteobacteria bacterium]|nr:hypothetical protein [Pseudomonadota bacterium]